MFGGLAEYSSMLLGFQYLLFVAVALYIISIVGYQKASIGSPLAPIGPDVHWIVPTGEAISGTLHAYYVTAGSSRGKTQFSGAPNAPLDVPFAYFDPTVRRPVDWPRPLCGSDTRRADSGRNVNMVAGTGWPDGDPFLQRQNEPTMAASTRNPLHLLGGSNDYRTVDLPGLPDDVETGDAWVSVYKSFDGGQRWSSTLLPGIRKTRRKRVWPRPSRLTRPGPTRCARRHARSPLLQRPRLRSR